MPRPAPSDTVPAMLTPGEAVLNREAAELMGRDKIKQLNAAGLAKRGYELNDSDMGLHRAGERPDLIRQDMTAKAMGFLGDVNGSPRPDVDMVTEQSIGMPLPTNYKHYPGLNPRPAPLTLPGREYYDVPSVVPGLDSEELASVVRGETPPTVYDKAAAHAADRQWAGKPVFAGAIEPVAPIKGDDMRKLQGYANGTEDAQLPPSVPPANRQAYIAGSPVWENPATGTGSYFRDRAQDLGLMDNGPNYKSPFKRVGPGDTAQLTKAGINKVGSSYAMTPGAVTGGKELTVHLGDSTSSPTTVGGITNVGKDFWGKQADLDAVTPTVAVGQTPAPYPKYGAQRSAVEQATSRLSAPAPHIDLLEQFNAGLGIQGFANGTNYVSQQEADLDVARRAAAGENVRPVRVPVHINAPSPYASRVAGKVAGDVLAAPKPVGGVLNDDVTTATGGVPSVAVSLPRPTSGVTNPAAMDRVTEEFALGRSDAGDRVGSLTGRTHTEFAGQVKPELQVQLGGNSSASTVEPRGNGAGFVVPKNPEGRIGGKGSGIDWDSAKQAVSDSAARLGQEYVDGYKAHGPLLGTVAGLNTLNKQIGRGYLGLDELVSGGINKAVKPAADNPVVAQTAESATQSPQLGGKLATELDSLVTEQVKNKADWNAANKWGRNVALNDVKNGEAVMKNDTGTYGYRQDEKGDLVKFDSNGNRVGVMGNVKANPEGTKTFWKNMGYPGGPEEYRARKAADAEQAQINRLMELSLNPPNDGTFTGAARARATQKYASDALDRMIASRDRNSAQQAEAAREEARLKMMGDYYTATAKNAELKHRLDAEDNNAAREADAIKDNRAGETWSDNVVQAMYGEKFSPDKVSDLRNIVRVLGPQLESTGYPGTWGTQTNDSLRYIGSLYDKVRAAVDERSKPHWYTSSPDRESELLNSVLKAHLGIHKDAVGKTLTPEKLKELEQIPE